MSKSSEEGEEIIISLDALELDAGTQPRVEMDEGLVREYTGRMLDVDRDGSILDDKQVPFPALDVFTDGHATWLADGLHRVRSARRAGYTRFQANLYQGTLRDAVAFCLSANAVHGKRRTNLDKRNAVERAFLDEEWSLWSDARIGRLCAVSTPTVGKIRRQLEEQGVMEPKEMRKGADGRMYPRASDQRALAGRASVRVRRQSSAGLPSLSTPSEVEEDNRRRQTHQELMESARRVSGLEDLERSEDAWVDVLFFEEVGRHGWELVAQRAGALLTDDGLLIVPNTLDLPQAVGSLSNADFVYMGACNLQDRERTFHLWGHHDLEIPPRTRGPGPLITNCYPECSSLVMVERVS